MSGWLIQPGRVHPAREIVRRLDMHAGTAVMNRFQTDGRRQIMIGDKKLLRYRIQKHARPVWYAAPPPGLQGREAQATSTAIWHNEQTIRRSLTAYDH